MTASHASNPQMSPALPQWDLTDLYAAMDCPLLLADMAWMEAECSAFAGKARHTLAKLAEHDPAVLAGLIADYEQISDLMGKIMSYAGLLYAGDNTDAQRAKFYGDTQQKVTDASAHLLFFELELNRIDDTVMSAALDACASLAHYRPWIEDLRKEKPHQLEDRIELLFLDKSVSGASAWMRLFDETVAGLRFHVAQNGTSQELGLEETLNLMQSPIEAVRKDAAMALATTFRANLGIFTRITNTLAKDKEVFDRWHGFADMADARHLSNRVEGEVVDALVSAVRQSFPRISHRYYALKAKWFGKSQLDSWDRNAPLPLIEQKTYTWEDAKQTVLGAYGAFSPRMEELARQFFDHNWIDAPIRTGKSPRAFAHPTVPSKHPYILVNFQGRPRDVMTLAHELGHGVHQLLAAPNGALMAPTPLTLAETASVFGEMLTFRSLLAQASSPAQRKAMLASKVEDMINTVVRQIAFYSFERKLHGARRQGELTADDICALWMSVQEESLGSSVRLAAGYESYWVYISHFVHSPFYVYAYAFGDCLVNSLYAVYERGGDNFVQQYFALLAAGGTQHHSTLLKPFGLDASDPNFWQLGLGLIDSMISELEAME